MPEEARESGVIAINQEVAEELDILRKAYPDLSNEQLKEAEEALDQYLEVVMRIYERVQNDSMWYAEFKKELIKKKK